VLIVALAAVMVAGCIFNIVAAKRISALSVEHWGSRELPGWPLKFFVGPRSAAQIRAVGIVGLVFFGVILAGALAQS
jgi:hypothetical protein